MNSVFMERVRMRNSMDALEDEKLILRATGVAQIMLHCGGAAR